MENIVIVAAARTAIGNFNGTLAWIPAHSLGAKVIAHLLQRTSLAPHQIDEVILGQALTAGAGQNPARQAAMGAGLPVEVPAMTINKLCSGGLKAVHLATQALRCGDAEIIIAGGQENMSLAPQILPKVRQGMRKGNLTIQESMAIDGLWDAFNNYHVGHTAENVAAKYHLSQAEQDAFAASSQQKVEAAQKAGYFNEQIVPVEIPQPKGESIVFKVDEFPRHGTTVEILAKLRPAFIENGTVTAGNSSGVNDGAAAVVVMRETQANALGLKPMARIVSSASVSVDPKLMGTAPIPATRKCLEKAGWTINDLDLIEVNEAFAAQMLAVNRELGWDPTKVNVNGGAIALGNPISASGARILVTLLHEMVRRDVHRGLATLCSGGGLGVALAVER